MLANILAKIISGAAVGYITNDLAIKMLFQEYLKIKNKSLGIDFSLGGVIVKEREEFQNQISRLVESDVIHHKAIEEELKKHHFEEALHSIFSDLFKQALPASFPVAISLGEIPAIEESFRNLKNTFLQHIEEPLHLIFEQINRQIEPEKLITHSQLEFISKKLLGSVKEFVAKDPSFGNFLKGLLKESSAFTLGQCIPYELPLAAYRNLSPFFDDLHQILKYGYGSQIEALLDKVSDQLEIKTLLGQLAASLSEKKLSEILTQNNVEHLPKELYQHIRQLFHSDISEEIIRTLLKFLLNVLEEERATLLELLSDDLKLSFENFLQDKLPGLISTLIPWIKQKKIKLEALIQESFDENTSMMGRMLVALLIGNVGKFVGIEEKIVDLIEKQDIGELSFRAASYLYEYLENNTIGDIIRRLNKEKILDVLAPVLLNNIRQALEQGNLNYLQNFLDKEIRTWFSDNEIQKALVALLERLKNNTFLKGWLYAPKFSSFTKRITEDFLKDWKDFPLSNWLSDKNLAGISENLQSQLSTLIEENKEQIAAYFTAQLQVYVKDKNLFQILGEEDSRKLYPAFNDFLDHFLEKNFEEIRTQPLKKYIEQISKAQELEKQISKQIKSYTLGNLSALTEGKVRELVKASLEKQDDEQLRGMVYKAMGRELKPLSYFGGILGAITGAMLLLMPEFKQAGWVIFMTGMAYGITGWGTNWLAIKMLFRPYFPLKIPVLSWPLPFTPGVVVKTKARFAQSMGRFIGDRLLNKESLHENFIKNKEKLDQNLKELITKEDYAFPNQLIRQNLQSLAEHFSNSLLGFLDLNQKENSEAFLQLLEKNRKSEMSRFNLQGISKRLEEFAQQQENREKAKNYLQEQLLAALHSDKNLNELFPSSFTSRLEQPLSNLLRQQTEKIKKHLQDEDILEDFDFKLIEEKIEELLQKNLEEILNDEQEEKLKNQLFAFIQKSVNSPEVKEKVMNFIEDKVSNEFKVDKNLNEIFGGKLLEMLENNLNQLLQTLIRMGMDWINERKEKIAEQVYDEALKENSLAWTYKNSIKGTTLSLIEEGIPEFFEKEFESLQSHIKAQVSKLGNLSLSATPVQALNLKNLDTKVEQILNNTRLLNKTRQLTHILLEERIFKIPLHRFLIDDAAGLTSHLKLLLQPEVSLARLHFLKRLEEEGKVTELLDNAAVILSDLLYRNIFSYKISKLWEGSREGMTENAVKNLTELLFGLEGWKQQPAALLRKYLDAIRPENIEQWIDFDEAKEQLFQVLSGFLAKEGNRELIRKELASFFRHTLSEIVPKLHPNSREFILHHLFAAFFEALEKNIFHLINSVDFKAIVVREIENMHPKELEGLFYGFARRYFTYLIGYGFIFGIIFGLAIDLGLLALWGLFG